jgi:uncharacterized membrane protein
MNGIYLQSAISPKIIITSLFGGILLLYGLFLVIGLSRPSVNSKQEIEYAERLFNISRIISIVFSSLMGLVLLVGLAYPSILTSLARIKVLYGVFLFGFIFLAVLNSFLYNDAVEEKPDYGKEIVGDENVLSAKKDFFIRWGFVMTIIGSFLIGSVIVTVLTP